MHGETATELPGNGERASLTDGPLLIEIPQALAALGGITRRELYNRINAGDIERVKIGKRAFITRASIEGYVERLRREAAARVAALRNRPMAS